MSWLYLSNPCAFSIYPLHTVLRVPPAPGLLRALYQEGANELADPGRERVAGVRLHVSTVIASEVFSPGT